MPSLFSWLKKDKAADKIQPDAGSVRTLRSTEFAFRLFEKLNPGERNLAVCPYGARVVLGILFEGSTGDTRKEMAEALQLDEGPNSTANCYERLGRPLGFQTETERRGLEMLTANSLWCDDGFVPREEYAKTLKELYWAEIQALSFRAPDAAGKVNRWAQEKTRGSIRAIISSLEGNSPLIALNAVYFKGLWITPFKAGQTKVEEFTLQSGTKKLVPMMRRTGEFSYMERGGAQIARLPYQGGMSMCVILPKRDASFPKFCAELRSNVGTFTAAMAGRPGHVRLPKFRIETEVDLTAPLKAMGIGQVFDPARAALERISEVKALYLKGVLQKDFVEVNEKGTEAAAVTGVFCLGALDPEPPPPPFEMIVDRPFVFAICDDFTRTVVFLGAVVDPLATQ
jgi:serine protease inhibitor